MMSTHNDRVLGVVTVSDVSIREAVAADTHDVTRLLIELGCSAESADVRRRIEQLQGGAVDRIFLAEVDGRVVGLLGIHIVPLLHREPLGRITALVVTKAHRGRGIGRDLLVAAERWALEQGCTQVELNSGDHHRPSHAFYHRTGYRIDDRRFIKEDDDLSIDDSQRS